MNLFTKTEIRILAILAFVQFTHIIDFMMLMPLGPQLMRYFHISPEEFGYLVGSYTFAAGISGFFSAFWIDRFDRKRVLQIIYLGFSIGTLSCAVAPTFVSLIVIRSLTGVFGGVMTSLVMTIVADQIDASRRGTAMSIVMMAFSFASVLGVPFGIWLGANLGWHSPFVFLGIISLAVTTTMAWGLPKMSAHLGHHNPVKPLQILKEAVTSHKQRSALLFIFALVLGQFTVIPYLSPSMVSNVGFSEKDLTWIYLLGGIASMISAPLIGRLSDLKGKKTVFYLFSGLSLVPLLLITRLSVTPMPIVLIITCAFFVCMGGRMIPSQAILSGIVPDYRRASFMSLTNSAQNITAGLAASIAGHIIVKDVSGKLINYDLVGMLAAGATVVAMLIFTQIKEPQR